MKCFVTGGAGFIGSHLVDRLLADGHEVCMYDNFSTGNAEHMSSRASCFRGDILDRYHFPQVLADFKPDIVYHLAAHADIQQNWQHPREVWETNVTGTLNVLEAMRASGCQRLVFTSTGSVYGDCAVVPTPEDAPMPVQTSIYAASKLAAEGLIQAYVAGGHLSATVFRFVSVLGPRYSHGHLIDFYRQLRDHSEYLNVLGDGHQLKSYLHVSDCVAALVTVGPACAPLATFNLGTDEAITVRESIALLCATMGLTPDVRYGLGDRGWIGDNPNLLLDTQRIRATGWTPQWSIRDAVVDTVKNFYGSV